MTDGGADLGPGRRRHAEHVMGTVVSFDVPARAREPRGPAGQIGGALGQAVRWLHWVDATFSPYRDDSDVSRFGRGALPLADCAPELAEVLEGCAVISARSGGYFTTMPGGTFDPSGYVKGWAIERAAAIFTAAGSAEHSVNGGGDVQFVGSRLWRVGIADPLRPDRLALVLAGRDFAVATSGVAERGAHIIDPYTGQPPVGLASITVVGATLAETDAYATAAFAMGPAARGWVESLDGYEAFAITATGATWQTSGFGAYLG
jgi:thiamine biosynthesis lipoprotein